MLSLLFGVNNKKSWSDREHSFSYLFFSLSKKLIVKFGRFPRVFLLIRCESDHHFDDFFPNKSMNESKTDEIFCY